MVRDVAQGGTSAVWPTALHACCMSAHLRARLGTQGGPGRRKHRFATPHRNNTIFGTGFRPLAHDGGARSTVCLLSRMQTAWLGTSGLPSAGMLRM